MENEKALLLSDETIPPSGELKSKKEIISVSRVAEEIEKLIPLAGTIELSEEKKKILFAPVKDEDVEIRPDGLIYLPWMEYVSRLRDAFGVSWTIIPKDMPKFQGNHVYWPFYLMIQGKLAGFAIGEQEYQPSNARMTYGDAVEGAKSNALMRLCKGLGISLELWKPSFVRGWKEKYAEEYYDKDKKKNLWIKKNSKQNTQPAEDQGNALNAGPEVEQKQITPEQSVLYMKEVVKHLEGYKNIHELRNGYKKHYHEWELNLLPNDMEKVTKHKDELKKKFEEGK